MMNFYRRFLPIGPEIQSKLSSDSNGHFHWPYKKSDKSCIDWADETIETFKECKQLSNATTFGHLCRLNCRYSILHLNIILSFLIIYSTSLFLNFQTTKQSVDYMYM